MLPFRGPNNDDKNKPSTAPSHKAVKNEKSRFLAFFLSQGGGVNRRCSNHKGQPNNVTPLHLAVQAGGDRENISLLLRMGADVNAKAEDGLTSLHIAAEKRQLEIVESLLEHGASVNSAYTSTFREGYTPLHLASESGSEEIIKLLLSRGANIDAKGKDGVTTLHIAVERGYSKIVEHLLKYGANMNSAYDSTPQKGYTLLNLAIQKGYERIVKLLLEYGANIDAQDKNGKTILHFAVEKGYSIIIEHILKYCPDVNNKSNREAFNFAVISYGEEYGNIVAKLLQYGFTVNPEDVNNCKLLYSAIKRGYLKIVEEFLKYGIDIKNILSEPCKPLHVAVMNKQEEVAKLLISYGADVNAEDQTKKTPIFYAIENSDLKITKLLLTNKANIKDDPELLNIAVMKKSLDIIGVLLQHGIDVNTRDKCGKTALHFIALDEDKELNICFLRKDTDIEGEIAKLLLSSGANVNAQTKDGTTTLHAAIENGYVKVIEALLEYNADVNARQKNGITALHIAAQKGCKACTEVLLKHGARVDSKFESDTTPLHIAVQNGNQEIFEVLLKFCIDVDFKDKHERTALHIASEKGHEQIALALLDHGSDINIISNNSYTPLDSAMAVNRQFDNNYGRSSERVAEILEHHIIKLKTANLYVSRRNLPTIDFNEMRDFQNNCEKEIASMRDKKIGNSNTSFYDILINNLNQLAILLENENILQILRLNDYKIKFPIYASMINCHFRKGERRKGLLKHFNKNWYIAFPKLSWNCAQEVVSYLTNEDLKILIDACHQTNISNLATNVDDLSTSSIRNRPH